MSVKGTMIQFKADKVKINGPKVDNSYSVTFEVGEYGRQNVQALLGLEPEQVLKVTVETQE